MDRPRPYSKGMQQSVLNSHGSLLGARIHPPSTQGAGLTRHMQMYHHLERTRIDGRGARIDDFTGIPGPG
jgi:hypothetical protein